MPPRRRDRVDDVLDRDNLRYLEQRLEQIVDQRMDRTIEQLTQRMAALMGNQNRENPNPNPNPNPDQEESGEESEGENYFANIPRKQQMGYIEDDRRRWEFGMRTEISEFHGNLKPRSFLIGWPQSRRSWNLKECRKINVYRWCSSGVSRSRGGGGSSRVNRLGGGANRNTANTSQSNRPTGSGMKCFGCGEEGEEEDVEEAEDPVFDSEGVIDEEVVTGDTGTTLVVRRSCLMPKVADDNWLRHNIFQSTCTVRGKKLGLKTEKHPNPYKLAWLKKVGEVNVSERALVSFSIGLKYKDVMWCDVVAMDACHLLLGRPWQYDCFEIHDERTNSYSFMFEGVKIVLMSSRETEKPTSMGGETKLLSLARFEEDVDESQLVYVLIGKEAAAEVSVPTAVAPVVVEFVDVFPDELPDGLPPLRDIQHQINLELGATLPNRPHYKMSHGEHEELQRQVEELLAKGHILRA
ncbi:hypothetical protein CRG98_033695 [Punica granatum]|uniref:Reverse transcriptase domain-containing protein n=1 Tax=Punica granatum TaxID=22663 RepID=A0A2I0IR24_PUNGR|nr:hypothetical protein CRG98_033695 [Punica granatum]